MAKRKEKCPYCGGKHIWKVGYHVSPNKGKRLRVKCQSETCAHSWWAGEKPQCMKYAAKRGK